MGVNARSKILPWLAAVVLLGAGLAAVFGTGPSTDEASGHAQRAAVPEPGAPAPESEPRATSAPPALASVTDAGLPPEPLAGSAPTGAPARHPVDLEKLRELLPGNLYWDMGVPTKDPEVLRKRDEEGRRWNELYGKVLSNTATEQEIHQYYEHRRKVSEDSIAFAALVLEQYGAQLPEQEQGLYALSIRMHRTRLEELPRQIEEALARKNLQDQRRQEWRGGGRGN